MRILVEVLFRDLKTFAEVAVLLALWLAPFATGGALIAASMNGFPSGRLFARAVARAIAGGFVYAVIGVMILMAALAGGAIRPSASNALMWTVVILACVVTGLSGFVETRWFKREGESPFWLWPNWRSFTLRRIFVVQFVLALALGWWLFTRRETLARLELLDNLRRLERRHSLELMPSDPQFD
jgi:MFS family permease